MAAYNIIITNKKGIEETLPMGEAAEEKVASELVRIANDENPNFPEVKDIRMETQLSIEGIELLRFVTKHWKK